MFNDVYNLLVESLQSIGKDLIMRLPHLAGALTLLVVAFFAARLGASITRKVCKKWGKRESLTDLLQRLVKLAIWVFAVTVAAMMVFPFLKSMAQLVYQFWAIKKNSLLKHSLFLVCT